MQNANESIISNNISKRILELKLKECKEERINYYVLRILNKAISSTSIVETIYDLSLYGVIKLDDDNDDLVSLSKDDIKIVTCSLLKKAIESDGTLKIVYPTMLTQKADDTIDGLDFLIIPSTKTIVFGEKIANYIKDDKNNHYDKSNHYKK